MKHFWDIQNNPIFSLFLCIFTNLFLVLLRKKAFLMLLLCIFTNRQKNAVSRSDAAGSMQAAAFRQLANSIRRRAFQPTKKQVFLQLPTSSRLTFLQDTTPSGRQLTSFRRQQANISRRRSSFLPEQISASRPSATFIFTNRFHPPTSSLFSRNLPQKKLSLRLSFSRCI